MLAATLGLGAAVALAESGDLSSVTMRVLDDLSGVDAVVLVLELDANRGGEEEGAEGERSGSERRDEEGRPETAAADDAAEEERRERSNERDELHGADQRGEGRLEDRDAERPAVPPAAVP
jgi:hypothetical protein